MVSTSTVKKSAAARPSQWAAKNVFQGVFVPRSGAGSMPWSLRIALIVLRDTAWPRRFTPPRMRCSPRSGSLGRYAYHERSDIRLSARSTGASRLRAVVFLGDEPPIPMQNGVGRHDASDVGEAAPAENLAFHS
jgi:hypothetical protein